MPSGYEINTPYPITFALHGFSGTAAAVAAGGYFGLKAQANDGMIFVAPQGIANEWADDGSELTMLEVILDHLETYLCIDTSRVFAAGFSAGAFVVNSAGCGLDARFRAIASYAGSLTHGCGDAIDDGVAYLATHGNSDSLVLPVYGEAARDEFHLRNNCLDTTTGFGSNGCLQYECTAGKPVVWCEFNGGHEVPSFAASTTWTFFSQF